MFQSSNPLFTKLKAVISGEGEQVTLHIGDTPIQMHYAQALDISRWIRAESRVIKAAIGNGDGRTLRSLGILENLSAKKKPLPVTDGVAIHVKSKLQEWHREDVTSQGKMLRVRIGRHMLTLAYRDGLKIAQHLRVWAKACMRNAGDTRHWSSFESEEDRGS